LFTNIEHFIYVSDYILQDNNNDDDTDSGSDAEDDGPAVQGTPATIGSGWYCEYHPGSDSNRQWNACTGQKIYGELVGVASSALPSTTEPATTENIVIRTRSSMSGGNGDECNAKEAAEAVALASDDAGVVDGDLISFKHFDVTQSP
jgi:hypothetical protein